ncbi:hypothetical protein CFter6_0062 [Collimonas fungivorans]|uniref:Uncharacterized protein n=1 Tax=Collimonas fungivorans TaxID=158899 RepID=A0A127P505_9BURK|nr:hypothetical protein CFter6_0062 [Collimonas fungivorans]
MSDRYNGTAARAGCTITITQQYDKPAIAAAGLEKPRQ